MRAAKVKPSRGLSMTHVGTSAVGYSALRAIRQNLTPMGKMNAVAVLRRASITTVVVCLVVVPAALAATPVSKTDRLIAVQFAPGTTASERSAARELVDAEYAHSLAAPGMQQVEIPEGDSATAAAIALRADPNVLIASPDGEYTADADYFNDTFINQQWALENFGQVFLTEITPSGSTQYSGTPGADIDAEGAWPQADPAGDPIGVIDTGVAYGHEDLENSIFVNQAELTGIAGEDDDLNGLTDDVNGWNFYDDNADPRDYYGHGTHVASIAAATTDNGKGVAGVSPWARVLPLRAADVTGTFSWAAIRQSVTYGISRGVRVFNGSFGGPDMDPAFDAIIEANPDVLFVFSAGNGGGDRIGDDHDSGALTSRFPCDVPHENVICVAATDWDDGLTSFSDYGVDSVDLAAPGARIYAAEPCMNTDSLSDCQHGMTNGDPIGRDGGPGAYQLLSGTSMAAPIVAGAASLLWGTNPDLHSSQIKKAIVESAEKLPALTTKLAYGSRLDLSAAMTMAASFPGPAVDWPIPPDQPGPDPDDGGGGGATPPTTDPPTTPTLPQPLTFKITRPRVARVGRSRYVKLKLRCSATCSAVLTVRPSIKSLKSFKVKVASAAAGTRSVKVKIPSGRLTAIRALLDEGIASRLRFSAVVTDAAGAKSPATTFSVRLAK